MNARKTIIQIVNKFMLIIEEEAYFIAQRLIRPDGKGLYDNSDSEYTGGFTAAYTVFHTNLENEFRNIESCLDNVEIDDKSIETILVDIFEKCITNSKDKAKIAANNAAYALNELNFFKKLQTDTKKSKEISCQRFTEEPDKIEKATYPETCKFFLISPIYRYDGKYHSDMFCSHPGMDCGECILCKKDS